MSNSGLKSQISAGWTANERLLKRIGVYVALYGTAALFLVPYAWMISTSLKPETELFSLVPHWIPSEITLRWYAQVLAEAPIVQWLINTTLIATATTLIVVIVDSMIAFSLTKFDWPGRKAVFALIMASFMVPIYVNMVPLYTLITDLGLLNNPLAVILPFSAFPLGVFLFVQFFEGLPDEVIEAALIDGFSSFQIYTRIVLPLMKPAMASLSLFTFVYTWNQFLWPLIVLQGSESFTLPVGVVTAATARTFQPGLEMAATFLAALPLFLVFLVLQEQIVKAVQMQGTTG
jgi:multiple sugar transport system permease protein